MGLAAHEFNISPEQLAGLVTDASDLQGTADLIEGQIAGFLDNVVGNIGGAADLGSIGRRDYGLGVSGPGDAGLNQNIRVPKGHRDVYGVGLFDIRGADGSWAGDGDPEFTQRANDAIEAHRRAAAANHDPAGQRRENAAWREAVNATDAARYRGTPEAQITPGGVRDWVWHGQWRQPDPNGDNAPAGSIGPREHLWALLDKLRTGGGLVEPSDSGGVGSLGLRVPAIFRANDPYDENAPRTSGTSFFWWGSRLDDPNPNR